MRWPLRLRLQSFAITLGVTVFEAALYGAPLGVLAWLAGLGDGRRIAAALGALGGAWSLGIALGAHAWPRVVASAEDDGKGGRR